MIHMPAGHEGVRFHALSFYCSINRISWGKELKVSCSFFARATVLSAERFSQFKSFSMAGQAKCAAVITLCQVTFFRIKWVMAGRASDPAIYEHHL
jgi:hypothetical protein